MNSTGCENCAAASRRDDGQERDPEDPRPSEENQEPVGHRLMIKSNVPVILFDGIMSLDQLIDKVKVAEYYCNIKKPFILMGKW